jgi:hypothetical protein
MLAAALILLAELQWFPGTSSIRDPEVIPPAFQGTWAPLTGSCDNPVELMTAYSDGIDTYESGGRLRRIAQEGSDRTVVMILEFEGEGQFWVTTYEVAVSEDGTQTTWRDLDATDAAITYRRCQGTN